MKEESPPKGSLKLTTLIEKEKSDRLILGFQEHEKVYGTPNATLSVIILATISNHFVSKILIDDGSSFNSIYLKIFTKLNLTKQTSE